MLLLVILMSTSRWSMIAKEAQGRRKGQRNGYHGEIFLYDFKKIYES